MRLLLLLLAAAVLASCARGGLPPGYQAQQQTVDGLTITLERPEAVAVLKSYDFTVALSDAAGKPVDGATVFLDLSMPAHSMGANQPIADPLGGGRYKIAAAVFPMDGGWRLGVHATVAGKEYVATFEQPVKPQ